VPLITIHTITEEESAPRVYMTEVKETIEPVEDDDSFMDWETRDDEIPIGKHIIAGKFVLIFSLISPSE
jgi:hypothetical protein